MQLFEKKYLVDSLLPTLKIIKERKLLKVRQINSIHYYGEHPGNDVEKFVEYSDRVEVHVYKDVNGKFTPTEEFLVKDKNEGISWLKKKGYQAVNIVKMDYEEYKYKNGVVGLYTIDDFLYSVILNYPSGKHEEIEKEFSLQNAKVITIPYNKLLGEMGKLRRMLIN